MANKHRHERSNAMSYLVYSDFDSRNFPIKLQNNLTFSSAKRTENYIKIDGLDGEVDNSDGTFTNVVQEFPFVIRSFDSDSQKVANDITNLLNQDNNWHELIFGGDPDYVYIAKYSDSLNLERTLSSYGKAIITFNLKPYKYLKSGLNAITLPTSIKNNTTRTAKPIIRIKGTGTITIKIGSSQLSLKNVDEGVIIDSRAQTITSLNGAFNRYNNMTSYPFPTIGVGNQVITTTGTITECTITPRWEVLV